jgi:hypothetical protein
VHKGTDQENRAARSEAEEGTMSIFTKADRELLEKLRNPRQRSHEDFFMEPIVEEIIEDDGFPSGVTA